MANLIAIPPAKRIDLIIAKLYLIPYNEVTGVYAIPPKTENIYIEYIGMSSSKLKDRIK